MIELASKEEFNELINKDKVVAIFSADWCPDCQVIAHLLPELVKKYNDYTFIFVERDKFIDICSENDIFGIPSFIAYHNGKEVDRFVSKARKTEEEINSFLSGIVFQ